MNPHAENGTKTYRGRALAEVLPRIREELGEDAVIVAQREDAEGGVGGFFAKRIVEVEARPGGAPAAAPTIDVRADEPAGPDAMDEEPSPAGPLEAAAAPEPALAAHLEAVPEPAPEVAEAPVSLAAELVAAVAAEDPAAEGEEPTFEEHLKALLRGTAPPAAPARQPVVAPQVAEDPREEPVAEDRQEEPVAEEPPVEDLSEEPPAEVLAVADINLLFAEDPQPAPASERIPEPVVESGPAAAAAEVVETEILAPGDTVLAVVPDPVADSEEPGLALASVPPAALPAVLADPRQLEVRDALVDAGLTDGLATALVEETVTHLVPLARDPSLVPLVQKALANRIPTHAVRGAGGRVVGFVGPGGSGKTRCVARLATAYARRSPMPVACVTLRPEDGGAELRGLLAPVGIPIHAEPDAESAAQRIAELREDSIVVLDTPGVSPRAEAEQRVLAVELAQLHADEIHVTVPATVAPRAAREIVAGTRGAKPCAIAITHADETEALGTVVELAMDSGLPISYVGRGHRVDVGLRPADASELAMALTS